MLRFHPDPFLNKVCKCSIVSENFGINTFRAGFFEVITFGVGNSSMGFILSSSICSPFSLFTNPKYFTPEDPN